MPHMPCAHPGATAYKGSGKLKPPKAHELELRKRDEVTTDRANKCTTAGTFSRQLGWAFVGSCHPINVSMGPLLTKKRTYAFKGIPVT